MINNAIKLQNTIDELGLQLNDSYHYQQKALNEYIDLKDKPLFDFKSFYNKWNVTFNSVLFDVILPKLKTLLGNDHYYIYHFLNPERKLTSILGWNREFNNIYSYFCDSLKALEEIIFRLEDQLALALKREIAQQENDQNVKYRITFSDHTRSIKINGIELAKPEFNSLSHKFFSYIYNRQGQIVQIANFEIDEKVCFSDNRRPVQVISDLGFSGNLKNIFFPVCTKTQVKFINPVTNKYAEEQELPSLTNSDLSGRVRQSKTE